MRRRVLVLGSSGFLGREVTLRLGATHDVIPLRANPSPHEHTHGFDLYRDSPAALDGFRPEVVVCTARLYHPGAHVGDEARRRERAFVRFLEHFASTRLLMLSTDAVFDGTEGSYREDSERNPTTAYGKTMRLLEDQVAAIVSDSCIVRASYLYGYSTGELDRRLTASLRQLRGGTSLEFFSDMYKSPLAVQQAAQAVCVLASTSHAGALHIGGPRMSIYDFQREALAALGADTAGVRPSRLPPDSPLARDTSLDTTLMTRLTGITPVRVPEGLRRA